jgi:hypothetical protein
MTRITLLKTLSITAGAVCVTSALANPAQAGTLGFDELPYSYYGTEVPDGYGGFDWNLAYISTPDTYYSDSIGKGVVSGKNVASAIPFSGAPGEISRSSAFTFKSAYLTATDPGGSVIFLVEGFRGSTRLFSQNVDSFNGPAAPLTAPTLFTFDWDGIDRLKFTSQLGGLAMDDFTFAESTTATPVPTPAVLPSLIGMGTVLWRKRKAKALAEASESV